MMGSALLHFVVVEMRPIYVFFLGVRGKIKALAVDAVMMREGGGAIGSWDTDDAPEGVKARTSCVETAVEWALWNPGFNGTVSEECVVANLDGHGYMIIGVFHYVALAVSGLFLAISLVLLVANGHWKTQFGDGSYLVFTWRLESMPWYRAGAMSVMVYVLGAIGLGFALTQGEFDALFQMAWTDIALILYSAYALLLPKTPAFNWDSAVVAKAQFRRPLKELLKQSNDAFGEQLTDAVLRAELGNAADLHRLAPGLESDQLSADPQEDRDGATAPEEGDARA